MWKYFFKLVIVQVARKVWLGNWNSSKDREPDKKEEQAFKEFLITKYERRQWYKSPSEVRREEEVNKPAATAKPLAEVKIQPPPGSRVRKQCTQECYVDNFAVRQFS